MRHATTNGDARVWHVSDDLAARYAEGVLPEPEAWSLEKHVEGCGGCAATVSEAVRGTAAGPVLAEIRDAVLASLPAPAPAPAAPAARRPRRRVPHRFARLLWAAGPAVRGAWLPAVLVVAAGALALAYGTGYPGVRALLLAVAPVVPVAGVALSYGPHADPLHEVAAATPGGGLRLALTRTVAVLAVSLPLLTLTGLLLPASGAPAAAAWLLPGLALALGSLALASFVGCRTAALLTGGGWLLAVLGPVPAASSGGAAGARLAEQLSRCLDGVGAQSAWASAAVLSAVLVTARRPVYDRPLGR
ncbi:zf-HC2 domain-containing protein [Streptomyces sp. PanSC9]|uniref:zf-HC2 domain-containing protein n=1 Tax=Streptomyces sp. PanSC9 TaxID=1520461 RepID=UPI000F493966|nr:zf-HC2 domain-containing protein [Streptomyces sp. PanSC9]ROP53144.1 putative zinc finger protein [Streptomyces sp. PanSC9]